MSRAVHLCTIRYLSEILLNMASDPIIARLACYTYDHIERPLANAIDSACLILSESNQFIVYTHNIDLSLISFLPHQNLPYLNIY